nr:RNA-directed DNA polymerase, eukaryota [Tanacetum cinerariifolium]
MSGREKRTRTSKCRRVYVRVIDVYIPFKNSKAGKKFAFVRFLKVDNLDCLVNNLCTIWIGNLRLQENVVKFQRQTRVFTSQPKKESDGVIKKSFDYVLNSNMQVNYTPHLSSHAIVLDDSCISEIDLSVSLMRKVKDINVLENLHLTFANEGFETVKLSYLGRFWVLIDASALALKQKLNFNHDLEDNSSSDEESEVDILEQDHETKKNGAESDNDLEIDHLPNSKKANEASKGEDPLFPPGFTPIEVENLAAEINVGTSEVTPSLGQSTKKRWIQELKMKHKINFIALQETKMESIDLITIKELWGIILLTMHLVRLIILGDFNEVRSENERFGSIFNENGVNAFNHFITRVGLIDLPLEGYSFTWTHPSASKMSKLDRFLVSEGMIVAFPSLSAICLERHLSDHRPIFLRELDVDYGQSPFRLYHSWFSKDDFDDLVEQTWKSHIPNESNSIISKSSKSSIQSRLADLDKTIDHGNRNAEIVNERATLLKDLLDLNAKDSLDMAQKAKIHWSVEGDENSKFFHRIINKKRSQLSIRGIFVEGDWVVDPNSVKNKFFNHFANRFSSPANSRIIINSQFPTRLSLDQIDDLERIVSYDEIKRAVWDCGANKSPGPDVFTFEFFRRYWSFIDRDVVAAIFEFFSSRKFPSGCNASFITLIPKTQDAKLVKDFRPISLIVSIYKIITKIMANRITLVIFDLVSDVQSAFVAGRQILDGPFILNELISWCKHHKTKVMIFKVDFEKAFDSEKSNISTLVNVLNCFSMASGLKINLHRSKLMGKGIAHNDVIKSASLIGCKVLYAPLSYLGVKLKTLSIGGRFTLTKAVLSSIPLYQMSMYRVPMGVLNRLESTRRDFFNGAENKERKLSLIAWKKNLSPKSKGSLVSFHWRSNWLDIIREFQSMSRQGLNLLSHAKLKLGDGTNTSFWNVDWLAESPLNLCYPRLFSPEDDKLVLVSDKLQAPSLSDSFRRPPR